MNSIDFFYSLRPHPLPDFGKHFSSCKKSAFRLELLSIYTVPEEEKAIALYLAGDPEPPADFNKEWIDILERANRDSVKFSRVRVIDGPLTDYIRFEFDWGYRKNIKFGEDIRFLMRDKIGPFQTPVPVLKDFWLFDDQDCFLMEYDYYGRFLGVTKVPSEHVGSYITLVNEAKQASISFKDAEARFQDR